MSKQRKTNEWRGKVDIRKIGAAVVAALLVVALVIGLIPNRSAQVLAAGTSNINGFSATMIADPDTSEDDHIFNGTPAEDGKIWTEKSVTTGSIYGVTSDRDNFYVALSALAQTYTTVETGLTAKQQKVAYDVVFVLDFSGSMNYSAGNVRRAKAMVDALNPAIETLMQNEDTRLAVVGYAGDNVNTSSATTLLALDHYSTTNKNAQDEEIYFEYTNNQYIQTVSGVKDGNGVDIQRASKQVNGGTPTQRGIYRGMDILQSAAKPEDDVIRLPIMVLLTDGAAGSARSNYTTLSGGTFYEGDANNGNDDAEVGAYTVLTANYAKDTLDKLYRERYDYTGILKSTDAVAKFYTIGFAIANNSWTHFMLDPSNTNASGNIVRDMKTILGNDSTYKNDYAYSDSYYGGQNMTADDLSEAFADIVEGLQVKSQVTTAVNDPVTTETGGSATGSNVVFTDYLGYKMELKGESQYLRYSGVNYRFDKQSDGSYKYSGYTQDGVAATGPIITKNNATYSLADVIFKAEKVNETYNEQTGYWKVTWSFPSALLPTYSRLNDYDNTNLEPIRMLYQVGLQADVNLKEDSLKLDANGNLVTDFSQAKEYVFHTNLYVYDTDSGDAEVTPKAMTWSEYTPAKDNPYYYETGYTTDKDVAGTTAEYVRLDMMATTTKMQEVRATADIVFEDLDVSLWNAGATFDYQGTTYRVSLTGNREDGATWTGEVSLPVVGETADGKEATANIAVFVEAVFEDNWGWNSDSLEISAVKIPVAEEQGIQVMLNNSKTEATVTGLVISIWDEEQVVATEEVVSVYMEVKGNATDGYYVEDGDGNKITVTKENDSWKVSLGEVTYYSHSYYKYQAGAQSYVAKALEKGTIAKSLAGYLEVVQPNTTNGYTLEKDFADIFLYHASNGSVYKATGVTFSDGSEDVGNIGDGGVVTPPKGTFKVCVDGIKNGQTDVNGNEMVVHFDFIVEPQTLTDGSVKYAVLDCHYWESGDKYAVDVDVATLPELNTETNNYEYAVSYTIESNHRDNGADNLTKTDPHFFHSNLSANGQMEARLGNNGLLAVDIDTAYDKPIKVEKEWYDRLGNEIAIDSEALSDVSITAGLHQTYQYTDANSQVVTNDVSNVAFAKVVLNQENDFTYTWEAGTLPQYLVDEGGDYVLDINGNKVEIVYKVIEEVGADGWYLSEIIETNEESDEVHSFVLHNVPLAEFSPSVQKVWTDTESYGYKVKIELLANGVPVVEEDKLDAEHPIEVTLTQESASANGELKVKFGEKELGAVAVDAGETRDYFFVDDNNGQGYGGAAGSGTHADSITITVSVSNTNGAGSKLAIADVKISYHFTNPDTNQPDSVTLAPFRSEQSTEGNVITATYIMSYHAYDKAEVILDEFVDAEETTAWFNQLDKWNLPMLEKDANGNYKAIQYSIRETVLVPDTNGTVEIDGEKYKEYTPDENGLIRIPQTGANDRVFKATFEHTTDYHFTVTNDEALTDVQATKVWVDNDNVYGTRPDSITFKLMADGTAVSGKAVEITPADTALWNGTDAVEWTNLPIYDAAGKEIVYTVEEEMAWSSTDDKDEYKTVVSGEGNEFVVTNSLHAVPAVNPTHMDVAKVWIDDNNAANTRPENIYMVLYRRVDGETTEELVPGAEVITLNADNNWQDTTTWTELQKYNEDGKKYLYSVKEFESLTARNTEGVRGYTDVSPSTDKKETSYKFTNQLDDGAVSKTVTKVWKDAALDSSTRPDVTVVLSGKTTDGEPVDLSAYTPTQVLSASGSWTYTWNNLPMYSGGMKVDYAIAETKVGNETVSNGKAGNYVVAVRDDGTGNTFTVTNTLTGETTVTVTKEWLKTPSSYDIPTVVFDVYNRYGGKVEGATLTVTKDSLTDSITLPKYNADGEAYYYTVEEQAIEQTEDYRIRSVVAGGVTNTGDFVYEAENTYVPLKKDIEGTKTWAGVAGSNIPAAITLELSRKVGDGPEEVIIVGGEALQPTWIKNGQTWTYKYAGVPVYQGDDESKPYIYTVKETAVGEVAVTNGIAGDYEVTIDGYNITNELKGTAVLNGSKVWENVSSVENVPDTIKIQLFRRVGTGAAEEVKDGNNNAIIITVEKKDQTDKYEWSYNFNNYSLDKYDANGSVYTYFVKELEVTAGNDKETASYPNATSTVGKVGDYVITLNGMDITNTLNQGDEKDHTTEMPFTKLWLNADGTPKKTNLPESITVQLLQEEKALNPNKTTVLTAANANVSDASKWHGKFKDLRTYKDNGISKYQYTVNETKVGTIDVNTTTNQAGAYTVSVNADGNQITNKISSVTTSVVIKKTWEGVTGSNIPSIKIQLLQSGTAVREITLEQGKTIENLVKNGNTWTYTFTNLPVYQPDGILEYVYSVKEIEIGGVAVNATTGKAGDYQSIINPSKPLEITNKLTGTVDEIAGKKIWKDAAKVTERPESVTVVLYRKVDGKGGELVETKVVSGTKSNAEWAFTFDNNNKGYAKYNADGNLYTYYVREKDEANGAIVINGNEYKVAYGTEGELKTIINTLYGEYNPNDPTPNPIQVTKIWKDDSNSQGKRPASVQMTLVQNGDKETITLTAQNKVGTDGNKWSATFAKTYPMYDAEGALIVYSVKENAIAQYTLTKNEGNAEDGFVLTNVYTPGNMTITVNKIWVDNDNALDTRPEKLTLNLFQNGQAYGTIEFVASEGNTWTATKNVPIADADGKAYTYTVEEPASALSGDYAKTSEEGLQVTNTLQGKVKVNGTKTWKNISEENLPENITVELWKKAGTANEVLVGEITTDAQKQWKYNFGEFDKYDENGALYTYVVKETKIDGVPLAETDYQVSNGQDYDLGNELKDIKINISGTKTWVDNNNQYKLRPESITVNLFRNGVKVDSVIVKAAKDGTWTYEFTNLSKYDMSTGSVYTYSVEEETVANYNSTVNGFDITNTLDETKIPKDPQPTVPETRDTIAVTGYMLTAIMALFVAIAAFSRRKHIVK